LSNPKIIAVGNRGLVSNMQGDVVLRLANENSGESVVKSRIAETQLEFRHTFRRAIVISIRGRAGRLPEEKA